MQTTDVAIAIVTRDGRVLIAQRPPAGAFAGLWEFPGGKCEAEESPEQCLQRELREEMGIIVRPLIVLPVIEHQYPKLSIRLHPFLCALENGEARPLAAQQIRWILPNELRDYEFPAANTQLIEEVILCMDEGMT